MFGLTRLFGLRYAGKALLEKSGHGADGSAAPIGLVQVAVGGSPIEFWIPPVDPSDVDSNPCEVDNPQCDDSGGKKDSTFWTGMVQPMAPYTLSAVVWASLHLQPNRNRESRVVGSQPR